MLNPDSVSENSLFVRGLMWPRSCSNPVSEFFSEDSLSLWKNDWPVGEAHLNELWSFVSLNFIRAVQSGVRRKGFTLFSYLPFSGRNCNPVIILIVTFDLIVYNDQALLLNSLFWVEWIQSWNRWLTYLRASNNSFLLCMFFFLATIPTSVRFLSATPLGFTLISYIQI